MRSITSLLVIVLFLAAPDVRSEAYDTPWRNRVTAEDRAAYAKKVRDHLLIEELAARIPNLSPAEEAWLQSEMSSTPERATRAVRSRERAIQLASIWVLKLKNGLRHLEANPNDMGNWVHVVYDLMDEDGAKSVIRLCIEEIIKCPTDDPVFDFTVGPSIHREAILMGIVGPSFGVGFGQ